MKLVQGYEYNCEITTKIKLLPIKVKITLIPESDSSCRGFGSASGVKVDVKDIVIDGDAVRFGFYLDKLKVDVNVNANIDNNGIITGTATVDGSRNYNVNGSVLKSEKIA